MTKIRLLLPLKFDHFELSVGTVIAVPTDVALVAVQRGIAEYAEPQTAVVEPQERRTVESRARRRVR